MTDLFRCGDRTVTCRASARGRVVAASGHPATGRALARQGYAKALGQDTSAVRGEEDGPAAVSAPEPRGGRIRCGRHVAPQRGCPAAATGPVRRRHPGESLDEVGDLGPGERVVPEAALAENLEQAEFDQPPEMAAGGRRRDTASVASTLAGSARPSASARTMRARRGSASTPATAARSPGPLRDTEPARRRPGRACPAREPSIRSCCPAGRPDPGCP